LGREVEKERRREDGKWRSGEVEKWRSGEGGKWGGPAMHRSQALKAPLAPGGGDMGPPSYKKCAKIYRIQWKLKINFLRNKLTFFKFLSN